MSGTRTKLVSLALLSLLFVSLFVHAILRADVNECFKDAMYSNDIYRTNNNSYIKFFPRKKESRTTAARRGTTTPTPSSQQQDQTQCTTTGGKTI